MNYSKEKKGEWIRNERQDVIEYNRSHECMCSRLGCAHKENAGDGIFGSRTFGRGEKRRCTAHRTPPIYCTRLLFAQNSPHSVSLCLFIVDWRAFTCTPILQFTASSCTFRRTHFYNAIKRIVWTVFDFIHTFNHFPNVFVGRRPPVLAKPTQNMMLNWRFAVHYIEVFCNFQPRSEFYAPARASPAIIRYI